MSRPLTASNLVALHDACLARSGWPSPDQRIESETIWSLVESNHVFNSSLWEEEDLARRHDVADNVIVANKRTIDVLNQKRNDAVEAMDDWFICWRFASVERLPSARRSSETAGAIIDRLSILSLKIHHTNARASRSDPPLAQVDDYRARCVVLRRQRSDLGACLDRLLEEVSRGESFFDVYRQFKMYGRSISLPLVTSEPESADHGV